MVAIKIIQKARFALNPATLRLIAREVEIMKSLDHVCSLSPRSMPWYILTLQTCQKYCIQYIDYFEDESRMW